MAGVFRRLERTAPPTTSRAEAYDHIRAVLRRFPYDRLNRADRGVIRAYLRKSTGFSRAQLTRLIAQHRDTGQLRDRRRAAKPFARRDTDADIRLLADTDELHEDLSAPAVRICAGGSTRCTATGATGAWPASPAATCTTCGSGGCTGAGGCGCSSPTARSGAAARPIRRPAPP